MSEKNTQEKSLFMTIDSSIVKKVGKLAKIKIKESDETKLVDELNNILGWVDELKNSNDTRDAFEASSEYVTNKDQDDICIGVPVVVGKNGWEKIIDLNLNDSEKELFKKSADAVRNMNDALNAL